MLRQRGWLVWFSVTFGQPSFSTSVSSTSTIMAEAHQVHHVTKLLFLLAAVAAAADCLFVCLFLVCFC